MFFYLVITLSWHGLAAKPISKAFGFGVAGKPKALGLDVAVRPT